VSLTVVIPGSVVVRKIKGSQLGTNGFVQGTSFQHRRAATCFLHRDVPFRYLVAESHAVIVSADSQLEGGDGSLGRSSTIIDSTIIDSTIIGGNTLVSGSAISIYLKL
jgi:hypothetical protein